MQKNFDLEKRERVSFILNNKEYEVKSISAKMSRDVSKLLSDESLSVADKAIGQLSLVTGADKCDFEEVDIRTLIQIVNYITASFMEEPEKKENAAPTAGTN